MRRGNLPQITEHKQKTDLMGDKIMNYWLHRIAHLEPVSYPLLENGLLSIGFSDFCNETFLNKVSNADEDFFDNAFQKNWGHKSRNRKNLWRFIAEMDKGDWVIVPSWKSFSVYEITESCALLASDKTLTLPKADWNGTSIEYDSKTGLLKLQGEAEYLDLGFVRKVKPICLDIPRAEYADSKLTARMKIQRTNADISDLKESIEDAIKNFKAKKPINLKSELMNKSIKSWKALIKKCLQPEKFEKLVQKYFEAARANSVIIPPKNPSGKEGSEDVDVIAYFENIKTAINVQVKFHDGETSDWAIQQITEFAKIKGNNSDGYVNQYWVISMADSFSEESYKMAIEHNCVLINGDDFVEMLLNVGIQNLDDI